MSFSSICFDLWWISPVFALIYSCHYINTTSKLSFLLHVAYCKNSWVLLCVPPMFCLCHNWCHKLMHLLASVCTAFLWLYPPFHQLVIWSWLSGSVPVLLGKEVSESNPAKKKKNLLATRTFSVIPSPTLSPPDFDPSVCVCLWAVGVMGQESASWFTIGMMVSQKLRASLGSGS